MTDRAGAPADRAGSAAGTCCAENVHRLGDALQRTHDLDGLLTTVLAAAASATEATRATAWLVEGGSVVARVALPDDRDPRLGAAPAADRRRRWPGEVAGDGTAAYGSGHGDASTPARRAGDGGAAQARAPRRSACCVVERDPSAARRYTDEDEETLVSLAGPAGIAVDNVLLHREAQRLSVTDPLTGAGNLRHMTTTLAREVERATRFERAAGAAAARPRPLQARSTTRYGHTVGDAVLRELARRLHEQRPRGRHASPATAARSSSSSLPRPTPRAPRAWPTRICEAVRDEPFIVGEDTVPVTVSVGVASLPDHGIASGDAGARGRRGALRRQARRPRPLARSAAGLSARLSRLGRDEPPDYRLAAGAQERAGAVARPSSPPPASAPGSCRPPRRRPRRCCRSSTSRPSSTSSRRPSRAGLDDVLMITGRNKRAARGPLRPRLPSSRRRSRPRATPTGSPRSSESSDLADHPLRPPGRPARASATRCCWPRSTSATSRSPSCSATT